MYQKKCLICNGPIKKQETHSWTRYEKQKYCSHECAYKAQTADRHPWRAWRPYLYDKELNDYVKREGAHERQ
jgi:hypothetical protein